MIFKGDIGADGEIGDKGFPGPIGNRGYSGPKGALFQSNKKKWTIFNFFQLIN